MRLPIVCFRTQLIEIMKEILSRNLLSYLILLFTQTYSLLIPDLNDGNIDTVDSDQFFVRKAPSLLPIENIGDGVFAKFDIPFGTIICEYRGPIITDKDRLAYKEFNPNARMLPTQGPDGEMYHIIGRNICSAINDCTSILNKSHTKDDVTQLEKGVSKCYDGFSYNARTRSFDQSGKVCCTQSMYIYGNLTQLFYTVIGKIFLIADRTIKSGEEIYFHYGFDYWRSLINIVPSAQEQREVELRQYKEFIEMEPLMNLSTKELVETKCGALLKTYTTIHDQLLVGNGTADGKPRRIVSVPHVSGFADRIVGHASVFLFGLLTNRAFQVGKIKYLHDLDVALSQPNINWVRPRDEDWLIEPLLLTPNI